MKRAAHPDDPALRADLEALLELPVVPAPACGSSLLTGRVVDTHHPTVPGRVLVRWRPGEGRETRAWLAFVRGMAPRVGDRVLLGRPDNEPQWLVVGVLAGEPTPVEVVSDPPASVRLQPGQHFVVEAHDGKPLLELSADGSEVTVRLARGDVTLAAKGRLRLEGRSVELCAGDAGVDVRTDKDVVIRGRNIRLN